MGGAFRPFVIKGDPSRREFLVPGLDLPEDVPRHGAVARHGLLGNLQAAARFASCGSGDE